MKINKILALGVLALLGFTSCDDPKEPEYTPADKLSGDQVYFPNTEASSIALVSEQASFDFSLCRVVDTNAATVALTSSATSSDGKPTDGIFTVPASVNFAAGQKEIKVPVAVDYNRVLVGVSYTLTVNVDNGGVDDPYANTSKTFTIEYSPWTPWELYSDSYLATYNLACAYSGAQSCPLYYRESLDDANVYQFLIPALNWFIGDWEGDEMPTYDQLAAETSDFLIFTIDEGNPVTVNGVQYPSVKFPLQVYNIDDEDGPIYIADIVTYIVDGIGGSQELAENYAKNNGYGDPAYFDPTQGRIMVPCGAGTEAMMAEGRLWSGINFLQLPGNFKSYVVTLSYNGNYVDAQGGESAVITIEKSDDVQSVRYKLYEGSLEGDALDAAYAEVKADRELPDVSEQASYVAFPGLEAGPYTLVAVGMDEGEFVYDTSMTFTFESVKKADTYKTLGWVEYTDAFITGFGMPPYTWEVEIQEDSANPGIYRLVNPYTNENSPYVDYAVSNGYMLINAQDPEGVYLELAPMGILINKSYGEMYTWSMAANYLEGGNSLEDIKAAGWCGTLEDGMITFPMQSLLLVMGATGDAYYANVWENEEDGQEYPTFCVDFNTLHKTPAKKAHKAKASIVPNFSAKPAFVTTLLTGKKLTKDQVRQVTHKVR